MKCPAGESEFCHNRYDVTKQCVISNVSYLLVIISKITIKVYVNTAVTFFYNRTDNMSGFPEKKRMDKKKKERTPAVKSWPQIQAEQRWARKMQAAQKDAETRFIIKRWVDLKNTLQKPREKRLAELREAEKRLAEDRQDMQRQERWREWRQKERELWEAEQRQKEQELNSKKKLEDLQETKTPHTQVLKSPTILEELKILDELLEEVRLYANMSFVFSSEKCPLCWVFHYSANNFLVSNTDSIYQTSFIVPHPSASLPNRHTPPTE